MFFTNVTEEMKCIFYSTEISIFYIFLHIPRIVYVVTLLDLSRTQDHYRDCVLLTFETNLETYMHTNILPNVKHKIDIKE